MITCFVSCDNEWFANLISPQVIVAMMLFTYDILILYVSEVSTSGVWCSAWRLTLVCGM